MVVLIKHVVVKGVAPAVERKWNKDYTEEYWNRIGQLVEAEDREWLRLKTAWKDLPPPIEYFTLYTHNP